MLTMKRTMTKDEFKELMSQIITEPTIGFVNPKLKLKLTDFANWTDWFRFGEWDDGTQVIYVLVEENNVEATEFLLGNGFVFQ